MFLCKRVAASGSKGVHKETFVLGESGSLQQRWPLWRLLVALAQHAGLEPVRSTGLRSMSLTMTTVPYFL